MSEVLDPIKSFKEERCDRCGLCFSECPVLELPLKLARKEIERLIAGQDTEEVLQRCTSCYACDLICPQDANPAELVLKRWHEQVRDSHLPLRARHFLPYYPNNFRTCVQDRLEPWERVMIYKWQDLTPAPSVAYPGCNVTSIPSLTSTSMFDDLDIRGGLQYCCGEMYYRMGMFEHVERIASRLQHYFEVLNPSKVTILCTAGYYIFSHVLPEFGADFSFELEHYLVNLKKKIDEGKIQIQHPLNMRVTIQDSCYSKLLGTEYIDLPRELLISAGAEVVEMGRSRECSLCCGIGAGFSPFSAYNPFKLTLSSLNTLREGNRSGADAIVTYCAGCLEMLNTARIMYRWSVPIYHLVELLQLAIGEEPERLAPRRAMQLFMGTVKNQFPALLSRKKLDHPMITSGIP